MDEPVPPSPAPVTVGAAPWWTSTEQKLKIATALGVVVLAFPKSALVAKFGLTNPDTVMSYINAASVAAPLAILAGGFITRIYSKIQPLTWSRPAAATHPATIAVVQVQQEMKRAGIDTAVEREAKIVTKADNAANAAAVLAQVPPPPAPQPRQVFSEISPELLDQITASVTASVIAGIKKEQAIYRASHVVPIIAAPAAAPVVLPPETPK